MWVATVSIGEQHGFVGDGGWLHPHADSEGGGGEKDIRYDGGVDSARTHGKEKGHLTTCITRRCDVVFKSEFQPSQ